MVFGAGIAAILARFGITTLIRHFWQRSRPFINNNVNLVVNYSNESSFPSGHAAFFFAIATVVYLHNKKAGILFFVGALLISLGRIFVGIHWPLDILAGAIVGIFSGWLASKIFRKIKL
jgi:undecaprenyl-diphosphatase